MLVHDEFYKMKLEADEMLRKSQISNCVVLITKFIAQHDDFIRQRTLQKNAIEISGAVYRITLAFGTGSIDFDEMNRHFREITNDCRSLLEHLEREIEESRYERRGHSGIHGLPNMLIVKDILLRVDYNIHLYMKNHKHLQ